VTQAFLAPARILVVDNDKTFLYALSEALRIRLEVVEVDTCHSARRALEQLETIDYDTVVTNVKMPTMDGLELLAAIRQRRPQTPTILITGYDEYHLAVRALRDKVYDILQKPLDWDYFLPVLKSAIQTRQLQRWQAQGLNQQVLIENPALLRGLKVLIVDDDRDGREMLGTALKGYGAQVRVMSSVAAALEIIDDFEPDILISDIRMPVEDGYSLLRKLRRKGQSLPAVAVTGYAEEEGIDHALQAGYQLQLTKPLAPELLALTVASLAGRLHNC
jgi:DNA-binding NtrC family response regulator